MTQGKIHRLRRIFQADGRTLLVAMDHAGFMGPAPGLIDPAATVRRVVAGGADAVMTTLGSARRCLQALDGRGLVLTVDIHAPDPQAVIEQALALGADGVKVLAFTATPDPSSLRNLGRYGVLCDRWGLPLQAEMIPGGFGEVDQHTPEHIATAARIGAEAGADYVKTLYTGSPETFRRVVEGAGVPVIILGGARASSDEELLTQVRDSLAAGGAGVAFGRNIWAHPQPERITAALARVIHGRGAAEQTPRQLLTEATP